MRYIGNKSKLLGFIGDALDEIGLEGGRALDAFAGTATVGSYLKSRGFVVESCDVMYFSYVLQRAYIVADAYPGFEVVRCQPEFTSARRKADFASTVESRFHGQADLFAAPSPGLRPLEEVLVFLDSYLEPIDAFICENFSADVDEPAATDRMYFTRHNARRIDAIRVKLESWRQAGIVTDDEYFILLACLLEAADAVANTTGVYAAFVKSWQGNAVRPLQLSVPPLVVGTGRSCRAHLGDVCEIAPDLPAFDLLYLDPPYNTRQYSGYYHVPELIARGWFDTVPTLRGKTGLIPDEDAKSAWSTREGCVPALEELIASVESHHVLMSYNDEGIIPHAEIERIFKTYGHPQTFRRFEKSYKRYRSDSDHERRKYKGDAVRELLYYVELRPK